MKLKLEEKSPSKKEAPFDVVVEVESAATQSAQAEDVGPEVAGAKINNVKELQPKARTKAEKAAAVKAKNDLAAAQKEAKAKALEEKAFEDAKVCTRLSELS